MDKNQAPQGALERIRRVVAQALQVEPSAVTMGAHFRDDLGADSLDMIELILALEAEFQADVLGHIDSAWDETLEAHVQKIETIADLVGYLELWAPLCCSRPMLDEFRRHERELALRAYLSQSPQPQERALAMLMTGHLPKGDLGWLS